MSNTFIKVILIFLLCGVQMSVFAQDKNEYIVPGIYGMPEEAVKVEQTNTVVKKAAVREDLHKFMGYEALPVRYLSLPFDVFIKNNVSAFFVDAGFLLLMLFPILFLFPKRFPDGRKQTLLTAAVIILCSLLTAISVAGVYLNKNNLSDPTAGLTALKADIPAGAFESVLHATDKISLQIYSVLYPLVTAFSGESDAVTYPLLFLLFIGLIFLVNARISLHTRETKALIFFLLMYTFLWWILGSGAAWYGILMFCVPYIFLIKALSERDETTAGGRNLTSYAKPAFLLSVSVIWLFLAFSYRATNYNAVNPERATHIYIPPVLAYQTGNMSEERLLNSNFPGVVQFEKILNQNEESLIYRVGTQMKFFIDKNDRRVIDDTFLDLFEKTVRRYRDKQKVIQVLKNNGVEYIVFDLVLSANDATPDKTLTRKFTNFLNTLYNNPLVELAATDRKLKLNDTGEEVFGVFPDIGTIAQTGRVAVFKIK